MPTRELHVRAPRQRTGADLGAGAELGFDDLTLDFPANSLADFSLSAPLDTIPVLQGHGTSVPVRVTRLNGSDGPVAFSTAGLPPGVTAIVPPNPLPGTRTDERARRSLAFANPDALERPRWRARVLAPHRHASPGRSSAPRHVRSRPPGCAPPRPT